MVVAAKQELPTFQGNPFKGTTMVLTGVFASGGGLAAGKDGFKAWLQAHGSKVVGSLSKKTSFLVIGKEPGASKVSQAHALGIPTATFESLCHAAEAGDPAQAATQVEIEGFSKGFDKRQRLV